MLTYTIIHALLECTVNRHHEAKRMCVFGWWPLVLNQSQASIAASMYGTPHVYILYTRRVLGDGGGHSQVLPYI